MSCRQVVQRAGPSVDLHHCALDGEHGSGLELHCRRGIDLDLWSAEFELGGSLDDDLAGLVHGYGVAGDVLELDVLVVDLEILAVIELDADETLGAVLEDDLVPLAGFDHANIVLAV